MRILTFSESDLQGGAETMALQLSLALRERGHHVEFLGPADGCGWLGAEFERRGIPTHRYRLARALDMGMLSRLRALLGAGRFDVVHAHQFAAIVYASAAARRGRGVVATMHGLGIQTAAWRRRTALRWALRRSVAVAVSDALAGRLAADLGLREGELAVVPNGVPERHGDRGRVRAELGLGEDMRLVLALGNLISFKGHDVLLRALRDRPPPVPWHLAIAGREEDNSPAVRALLGAPALQGRVSLLGARGDVPDLLAAADVFVHPSVEEGLPLALLEAMTAGLPIVASAVGGIPAAARPDLEALLVPPRDEAALAGALETVLLDDARARRLGAAARARARARYGQAAMVDAYESLYERARGGRHAA